MSSALAALCDCVNGSQLEGPLVSIEVHDYHKNYGDTVAVAGKTVMFTVNVAGTPPFFYQWRFNGKNIPGAKRFALYFGVWQRAQLSSETVY